MGVFGRWGSDRETRGASRRGRGHTHTAPRGTIDPWDDWEGDAMYGDMGGSYGGDLKPVTRYTPASGGWGTTTYKSCRHDGTVGVYYISQEDSERTITFGGGSGYATNDRHADLILDLARNFKAKTSDFVEAGPGRFLALNKLLSQRRAVVVQLDWPDRTAPWDAPLKFWRELVKAMFASVPTVEDAWCTVCCIGGHGRTGTALAAILLAHSHRTVKEALALIRERHCKDAVESVSQEEYLDALVLERDAEATAAKAKAGPTNGNGNGNGHDKGGEATAG